MRVLAAALLEMLVRGGCASPAYLDVERTLDRARAMLDSHSGGSINPAGPPIASYRALATRLGAHAEQLFRGYVREQHIRLPGGVSLNLPTWTSDGQRLTYRLLLTYRQQAEQRIADLRAAEIY